MSLRDYNYPLLEWIEKRWSPRAISPEAIDRDDVAAVIDAARQAPSCFNEQPWRFIVAQDPESLEVLRGFLSEKNHRWAGKAPVLMLILATKTFKASGKPNRWNQFDSGTAWGFLSLEALRRGYVTHAMAGYSRNRVIETLKVPEDYDVIAMVAMGRYGNPADLDADFLEEEEPSERMPLEKIMLDYKAFMDKS